MKIFSLILLTLILNIFCKEILSLNDLVLQSLTERISKEQIETIIDSQSDWKILQYIIISLLILLKVLIVSAILDIGCFFFNKKISYKELFSIVVKAEFLFLLVIISKTIWFYYFQPNFTLEDFQYFYPFSALNIIGYQNLETWFIYPFQVFNLFEIAYWFILAYLIGKKINSTTEKGLSIVASSYGVGLLIWVVGVMFLTLNIS